MKPGKQSQVSTMNGDLLPKDSANYDKAEVLLLHYSVTLSLIQEKKEYLGNLETNVKEENRGYNFLAFLKKPTAKSTSSLWSEDVLKLQLEVV